MTHMIFFTVKYLQCLQITMNTLQRISKNKLQCAFRASSRDPKFPKIFLTLNEAKLPLTKV